MQRTIIQPQQLGQGVTKLTGLKHFIQALLLPTAFTLLFSMYGSEHWRHPSKQPVGAK